MSCLWAALLLSEGEQRHKLGETSQKAWSGPRAFCCLWLGQTIVHFIETSCLPFSFCRLVVPSSLDRLIGTGSDYAWCVHLSVAPAWPWCQLWRTTGAKCTQWGKREREREKAGWGQMTSFVKDVIVKRCSVELQDKWLLWLYINVGT